MSVNSTSKIFLALFFVVAVNAAADELILKEGKTLQGRITHEDAREYTIMLGSNMVLRVDKSKVAKVVRSAPPPAPTRPILRSSDLVVQKSTAAPVSKPVGDQVGSTVKSSTAAVVKKSAPAALQPAAAIESSSAKIENVRIEKTLVTSTVSARGPDPAAVQTSWLADWEGEAQSESGQHKWKWAVVRATITTALPRWNVPLKAAPEAVEAWNTFLPKAGAYAAGRLEIYSQSMDSFASELVPLRAKDEAELRKESEQLFQEMKNSVEKKLQGHDRRTKKIFDIKPK